MPRCHFQSSTKAKTRYMFIFAHISFLFLKTTPISNPKGGGGGGILYMHVHFPMGPRPTLAPKRGGGGHVPEMPPPPPPPPDPPMLRWLSYKNEGGGGGGGAQPPIASLLY